MKLQQQNRNWGGKKTKQNKKTGKDGMPYTQCNTRAAHICEREFRFVGQPLGAHRGRKALFGNNERRARREKSRGLRCAPEATGRGRCSEVLCWPQVPLLWPRADCGSHHSSAAACAAAHPPSTSSLEASGPPLGAERTH